MIRDEPDLVHYYLTKDKLNIANLSYYKNSAGSYYMILQDRLGSNVVHISYLSSESQPDKTFEALWDELISSAKFKDWYFGNWRTIDAFETR